MEEVPKLFCLNNSVLTSDASPPSFVTPLGRLILELEVGGVTVSPAVKAVSGSRSVTLWTVPIWFEVLVAPASVSLPPGMAVADAWAVVWRVSAAELPGRAVIKCLWADGFTWSDGGPESGIYKTTDAGLTWSKLAGGLPTANVGRIDVAVAPSNPNRLYAIVVNATDANGDGAQRFESGLQVLAHVGFVQQHDGRRARVDTCRRRLGHAARCRGGTQQGEKNSDGLSFHA